MSKPLFKVLWDANCKQCNKAQTKHKQVGKPTLYFIYLEIYIWEALNKKSGEERKSAQPAYIVQILKNWRLFTLIFLMFENWETPFYPPPWNYFRNIC